MEESEEDNEESDKGRQKLVLDILGSDTTQGDEMDVDDSYESHPQFDHYIRLLSSVSKATHLEVFREEFPVNPIDQSNPEEQHRPCSPLGTESSAMGSYAPFLGPGDYGLARWLTTKGISREDGDELIRLLRVSASFGF